MVKKYGSFFRSYFKDFGYKVVRLKYFIMVVGALILEIIAVTIFILNIENLVEFQLFTTSVLFGVTSAIIIVLAIGVLVLIKVDKNRDHTKIKQLIDFKKEYEKIQSKHLNDINRSVRIFDNEKDIDSKIDYALVLKNMYNKLLKEYSLLNIPGFLKNAYNNELDHLIKEKQFYESFSSLASKNKLDSIVSESDLAHMCYLIEMERLEKNLKLII